MNFPQCSSLFQRLCCYRCVCHSRLLSAAAVLHVDLRQLKSGGGLQCHWSVYWDWKVRVRRCLRLSTLSVIPPGHTRCYVYPLILLLRTFVVAGCSDPLLAPSCPTVRSRCQHGQASSPAARPSLALALSAAAHPRVHRSAQWLQYPGSFLDTGVARTYPYLLPCSVGAVVSVADCRCLSQHHLVDAYTSYNYHLTTFPQCPSGGNAAVANRCAWAA